MQRPYFLLDATKRKRFQSGWWGRAVIRFDIYGIPNYCRFVKESAGDQGISIPFTQGRKIPHKGQYILYQMKYVENRTNEIFV